MGWVSLKEREGDSPPAWGRDRTWYDREHGPLNHLPLLAACPWAGLPPSPGARTPKIFHPCPHREELSPSATEGTASRQPWGSSAVRLVKPQPLPMGKKKKSVPFSWWLPDGPSSYQALFTSRWFLCCCTLTGSSFSPRTPHIVPICPSPSTQGSREASG